MHPEVELREISPMSSGYTPPHAGAASVSLAVQMTTQGAPELATPKRPTSDHRNKAAVWKGIDEHGGYADSGEKTDDAEGNREDPERGKLYLV